MQVPGVVFEEMEAGELCGAVSAESPLIALNSAWCDAWHWVPKLLPLRASARVFPCLTRGVRIIFLFWKLKSAPRVGDH